MSRFIDMKSLIVIPVCFQYAAVALASKDEIVEKMSEKLESQLELGRKSNE